MTSRGPSSAGRLPAAEGSDSNLPPSPPFLLPPREPSRKTSLEIWKWLVGPAGAGGRRRGPRPGGSLPRPTSTHPVVTLMPTTPMIRITPGAPRQGAPFPRERRDECFCTCGWAASYSLIDAPLTSLYADRSDVTGATWAEDPPPPPPLRAQFPLAPGRQGRARAGPGPRQGWGREGVGLRIRRPKGWQARRLPPPPLREPAEWDRSKGLEHVGVAGGAGRAGSRDRPGGPESSSSQTFVLCQVARLHGTQRFRSGSRFGSPKRSRLHYTRRERHGKTDLDFF